MGLVISRRVGIFCRIANAYNVEGWTRFDGQCVSGIFGGFILLHADTDFDEFGDEVVTIGMSSYGFAVKLFQQLFISLDGGFGHFKERN
jgi:hypothetical protein